MECYPEYISIYAFKKMLKGWYTHNVMSVIVNNNIRVSILHDNSKYVDYDNYEQIPEKIRSNLKILKKRELKSKETAEIKKCWNMVYLKSEDVLNFIDQHKSKSNQNVVGDSTRTNEKLLALLYMITHKWYKYEVGAKNGAIIKILEDCNEYGDLVSENTLRDYLKKGFALVGKTKKD